jgi:Serine carboxypeptidase
VSSADHSIGYTEVVGKLLDKGLRILLYAGDADYICNWYGVEAVSLEIPWSGKSAFIKAGYTDFVVDDRIYGQVRQAGNFTFLRVWNSGHEVPYYQPKASLEMFQRMIRHREMAEGLDQTSDDTVTNGTFLAQPIRGQDCGLVGINDIGSRTDVVKPGTGPKDPTFWKRCKKALRIVWGKIAGLWWRVDNWLAD